MALAWRTGWRVPDRRFMYEWASEYVNLPTGVYAIGGKFNVLHSRFLIKPFQALQDDRVRVVTVKAPVRSGKTLLADIWLPWTLVNAPGPFMWNMSTDTLARRHCRTRALPLLRGVHGVRDLLPEDPRQQSGQEIIFRNGVPFYIQGPSIDNLQGVGVRYLVEDEVWRRAAGRHQEAMGRLGDYQKINASKMLVIGQAGIEDDDMDLEFLEGSQEEFTVPCGGCGKFFTPVSTGYREDGSRYGIIWGTPLADGGNSAKDKNGNWIKSRVMESARYACPLCGYEHTHCPTTQVDWNKRGEYMVMNHEAPETHKSFHVFATVMRDWMLLAEDLAQALNAYKSGILDLLITYTQKYDALSWSESLILNQLKAPTYSIEVGSDGKKAPWAEEAVRILVVDKQENHNWALVFAASRKGELRRLFYGKPADKHEIKALQDEWGVKSNRVFVDCSWEAREVYGWCCEFGWFGLNGDQKKSFVHQVKIKGKLRAVLRSYSAPKRGDPESGKVGAGRRFAQYFHWSNPTNRAVVRGLLERGRIVEPANVDPGDEMEIEYRKQMRGQWRKKVINKSTGKVRFEDKEKPNDHARDCWNMGVTALKMLKLLPDIESESVPDGLNGEKKEETSPEAEAVQ